MNKCCVWGCDEPAILRIRVWSGHSCVRRYSDYHYRCQAHRFNHGLLDTVELLGEAQHMAENEPEYLVPELPALPDVLRRVRRNAITL